jgi:predicted NAD/FAD-binding protein
MTKIAVIGSGISGLSTSYFLSKNQNFHVDLYEKESRLGGHTHTHELDVNGDIFRVDSGFIVLNKINYPNLINLFQELEVDINPSSMSFSYNDGSNVWSSEDYKKPYFLLSKSSIKRFLEIIRFKRLALSEKNYASSKTLWEWLTENNFSQNFIHEYVVPMASSIWSSDFNVIKSFPLQTFINFYDNHQLFNLVQRPQWQSVNNGSSTYINKMQASWNVKNVFLESNPQVKKTDKFQILHQEKLYDYDKIIFGCHANQINSIFPEINNIIETNALSKFKYSKNFVSIHTDQSVMPSNKTQWSSWNVQHTDNNFFLTYWMNNLQKLTTTQDIFVSLGEHSRIDQDSLIKTFEYQHPIYSEKSIEAQGELNNLQGKGGIYFVGAYLGYGFHEDGLNSAIRVSNQIMEEVNVF